MALARESWYPQAQELDVGQKRRVSHDCGPGTTLIVSRDDDGYRAYCFRCNEGDRAAPPAESLSDKLARLARQRSADAVVGGGVDLPQPVVRSVDDWPAAAKLWLYQAGLGRAEIGQLGAYYHPPTNRVVLPVLDRSTGMPVFWQARSIDGRQPKYLAPPADRSRVLPRWGTAPVPTLTEDILSAFKVGLVAEGWCVMGTKVSDYVIALLMKRGECNVWLDNDLPPKFSVNRGQIAAAKIGKQLRAYGIQVRNILSTRDPKLMHRAQIKELLA
jgi:hypothetical protein